MAPRRKLTESDAPPPPATPGEGLINKYRPQTFDEVVGHGPQVKAFKHALKTSAAKTFLLVGPSGVGKTTLARIAAAEVGCALGDLTEIDAATNTGIDDMRNVTSLLEYRPIGGGTKAIIVDEVHALSANAFKSLLKSLEEPPPFVYWFLCTTDPQKVPAAIKTRCFTLDLKPVKTDDIIDLLDKVAKEEDILADGEAIIDVCAEEAKGSPRQALSNLALCATAADEREALKLLQSAEQSPEAVDLARALIKGVSWSELQKLLAAIRKAELSPESVRHVVRSYVTSVILGAKSEADAGRGLELLDLFSQPFSPYDGVSPLVLACGKAKFS